MEEIVMGRIEQLTDSYCPPNDGSGVTAPRDKIKITVELDTTQLDEAQQKADKLKATLLEVQELVRQTNLTGADIEDRIIGDITDAINRSLEHSRSQ